MERHVGRQPGVADGVDADDAGEPRPDGAPEIAGAAPDVGEHAAGAAAASRRATIA